MSSEGTRILLHCHNGEPSDQRTSCGTHMTATTIRKLLPGRVIALQCWRPWWFHRRRRRWGQVTTRTRMPSSSGFRISSLSVCIWSGGICDHVWREDIVECYAAVVSFSPCLWAITAGGRGRCRGVICRSGSGGEGGRALDSTSIGRAGGAATHCSLVGAGRDRHWNTR
jgi:hypothetical protein